MKQSARISQHHSTRSRSGPDLRGGQFHLPAFASPRILTCRTRRPFTPSICKTSLSRPCGARPVPEDLGRSAHFTPDHGPLGTRMHLADPTAIDLMYRKPDALSWATGPSCCTAPGLGCSLRAAALRHRIELDQNRTAHSRHFVLPLQDQRT